jgi:DNA excision repair protein ERCC-8
MLYNLLRERSITQQDPLKLHYNIHDKKWKQLILANVEFPKNSRSSGVTCLDVDHTFNSYLISGSLDSSLMIYDLESLQVLAEFERGKAHALAITDAQWFPFDSNIFVTASRDMLVKLWDSNSLKSVINWKMNASVYMTAIPANHSSPLLVAVGMEGHTIRMCDLKSGASTHTLRGHSGSVHTLQWSPHHSYMLASGSSDGYIKYWDIRKASPVLKSLTYSTFENLKSHTGSVKGLSFSSDGLWMVSVGQDNVIRLWDGYNGTYTGVQASWSYGRIYTNVRPVITHSADTSSPKVYLPNNKHIQEFDLMTLDKGQSYFGHYGAVSCIALDRSRTSLYSVSINSLRYRVVQIKKYCNGLDRIMFQIMGVDYHHNAEKSLKKLQCYHQIQSKV